MVYGNETTHESGALVMSTRRAISFLLSLSLFSLIHFSHVARVRERERERERERSEQCSSVGQRRMNRLVIHGNATEIK
jgi:hypothetical protein